MDTATEDRSHPKRKLRAMRKQMVMGTVMRRTMVMDTAMVDTVTDTLLTLRRVDTA